MRCENVATINHFILSTSINVLTIPVLIPHNIKINKVLSSEELILFYPIKSSDKIDICQGCHVSGIIALSALDPGLNAN